MTDAPSDRAPTRALRLVLQSVAFLIGLGMMGWCVRAALSDDNREQLARLREATPGQILLLLALSAGTLWINGLLFWVTLRPVHKVRAADHIAINALCTFLAFLPFKLGTLTRVAINNRRDKVPLLTIGAWYGVMFAVMLAAYIPAMCASVWRGGLDVVWWVTTVGGATILCAGMVAVARRFTGEVGLARLHKVIDGTRLPLVSSLARTDHFNRMHTAAAMGASTRDMAGGVVLRLVDLGVMAGRFVITGSIVGIAFGWEEAVLAASAYYIIGMLSPFGMLGARETGTAFLLGALGLTAASGQSAEEVARSLTVLTLFITGTESIVLVAGAAAGLAWLRPDRLFRQPAAPEPSRS